MDHSSGKMLIMVPFEVVLVLYVASYDFPLPSLCSMLTMLTPQIAVHNIVPLDSIPRKVILFFTINELSCQR